MERDDEEGIVLVLGNCKTDDMSKGGLSALVDHELWSRVNVHLQYWTLADGGCKTECHR